MSTTIRRLNLVVLAFAIGLAVALATAFASVSTAWADSFDYYLDSPGKTIALPYFSKDKSSNYKVVMGDMESSAKVKNVKSSNKKVVAAKAINSGYSAIRLTFKKPGKSTLTYTYKGKKYKVTIITKKYGNPLKTFKIGSTDVLSEFSSKTYGSTSLAAAGKLSVKAKSGWKITGMRKHTTTSSYAKIKNGSQIGMNTTMIFFDVVNKKTKVTCKIILDLEQAYN